MKSEIIRISQVPPPVNAAPAPPIDAGPIPGGDLGGMMPPPMPTAGGGMPAGAPTAPAIEEPIRGPLENTGQIFKDARIEERLKTQFSSSENEETTSEDRIGEKIWIEYGGNDLKGVIESRRGKRKDNVLVDDEEIKRTENCKWERLPEGKNLSDLGMRLEEFQDFAKSISLSMAMMKKKEAPGGGGMGMASIKYKKLIKLAHKLDNLGLYELADKLI